MTLQRRSLPAVLPALSSLLMVMNAGAGEVLYNGIELPDQWPPGRSMDELRAGTPMRIPNLQRPPEVIPMGDGREDQKELQDCEER